MESPNWSKRKRMLPFVQKVKMSFLNSSTELPPQDRSGTFTIITRQGTLERARILRAGPGWFVWRSPELSEKYTGCDGNHVPYSIVAWKKEVFEGPT